MCCNVISTFFRYILMTRIIDNFLIKNDTSLWHGHDFNLFNVEHHDCFNCFIKRRYIELVSK